MPSTPERSFPRTTRHIPEVPARQEKRRLVGDIPVPPEYTSTDFQPAPFGGFGASSTCPRNVGSASRTVKARTAPSSLPGRATTTSNSPGPLAPIMWRSKKEGGTDARLVPFWAASWNSYPGSSNGTTTWTRPQPADGRLLRTSSREEARALGLTPGQRPRLEAATSDPTRSSIRYLIQSKESTMRIDNIRLTNFDCFEDRTFSLAPRFTLIVGDNATGKTSVLDGLAVGVGSLFLGFPSPAIPRSIFRDEVRWKFYRHGDTLTAERQFPAAVNCEGLISGQTGEWVRELTAWKAGPRGNMRSGFGPVSDRLRSKVEARPGRGSAGGVLLWDGKTLAANPPT